MFSPHPVAQLETWEVWLQDLRNALTGIHHHREMWKAITQAIYERAGESPGTWINHYRRLYVDGQAMAVRRLIRSGGRDTITIGRLLESIEENATVLTVERYVSRWAERFETGPMLDVASREFEDLWGDGNGRLDLKKLRRDKSELNVEASKVIDLADQTIAHIVDGRPQPPLTFGELDAAIDHTGRVFQHYATLITATHYVLTPRGAGELARDLLSAIVSAARMVGAVARRPYRAMTRVSAKRACRLVTRLNYNLLQGPSPCGQVIVQLG